MIHSPADLVLTRRGLRVLGRYLPCSIGKGGLRADKREGDGATPVGEHRITGMLYRPDRLPAPRPWAQPIRPGDLWSDASSDPDYNSPVRAPYPASHEVLRRADPLYDIVLLTDWNEKGVAGRGSAIFLHQRRRAGFPTEGCVAFARPDLLWLARHIVPGARLIVR